MGQTGWGFTTPLRHLPVKCCPTDRVRLLLWPSGPRVLLRQPGQCSCLLPPAPRTLATGFWKERFSPTPTPAVLSSHCLLKALSEPLLVHSSSETLVQDQGPLHGSRAPARNHEYICVIPRGTGRPSLDCKIRLLSGGLPCVFPVLSAVPAPCQVNVCSVNTE